MDYVCQTVELAVSDNSFFKASHFLKGTVNHSEKVHQVQHAYPVQHVHPVQYVHPVHTYIQSNTYTHCNIVVN